MYTFVGFRTLEHATYSAHVRSMDHSVVMPFAKHFQERTKQVEEDIYKVEDIYKIYIRSKKIYKHRLPTQTHT